VEDIENIFKTVNEEEVSTLSSLGDLPIGRKFKIEKAETTFNEQCGRGIRFFFHEDGVYRYTYIPKRYSNNITEDKVIAINVAAQNETGPGFAFMGKQG